MGAYVLLTGCRRGREFNKFNNTEAQLLHFLDLMTTVKFRFWRENDKILLYTLCVVMDNYVASAHLSELFHRVNMGNASMMLDLLCLKILGLFILALHCSH